MRLQVLRLFMGVVLVSVFSAGAFGADADSNWPTWRGPRSNGVVVEGNPPLTWSDTENVKWKVPVPDTSNSTPVVWGDRLIFLSNVATAEDKRTPPPFDFKTMKPTDGGREIFMPVPAVPYRFNVVCLSRKDGSTLWTTKVAEVVPHEGHHGDTGFTSTSAITDGEYIWASFGSRGLHCLDMDGEIKWSVDLMDMLSFRAFGECAGAAIAGDTIVVLGDHVGQSRIWAFNKLTGEKLWEKDRDEDTSWTTPAMAMVDGRYQAIIAAEKTVRSYDVETGDVVWEASGLTRIAIPSPVLGDGMVYVMTGEGRASLMAIELGHTGDLTDTDAIKWRLNRNQPYVSTPLLYGNKIYTFPRVSASLSCYNAETGEPFFESQRLEGLKQIYSSAIGAAGRVYLTGRAGTTIVLKHSDEFEVLATNSLGEGVDASLVVIGDELYIKGKKHLYCIAEDQSGFIAADPPESP